LDEGGERYAVILRLAEILETRMEDVAGAVDRYAEVLGVPEGGRTRGAPATSPPERQAVAALERLAGGGVERHRIATTLEPIYRRANDLDKLAGALDAQLESVDDRTERIRILRELADLHQRMGRIDLAFDCRTRAWLADVEAHETLAELQTLGISAKLYGPLAAALSKGAVEAGDPDLQAELWSRAARLLEDPLGHQDDAIEAWRSVLGARPDDTAAFLALERLFSAGSRSAELVDTLEKHLEMTPDANERKAMAKRIAVLYEDALGERERAVRAWETVLEIDPAE